MFACRPNLAAGFFRDGSYDCYTANNSIFAQPSRFQVAASATSGDDTYLGAGIPKENAD